MKITEHHGFRPISLSISLLLSPEIIKLAGAQSGGQTPPPNQPYNSTFTPSLAIIVSILIAALVFMLFFSIYVRYCAGDTSTRATSVRRAISLRNRRAAEARGLDASVIETFPTFSYSEVKDHHIGYKGELECAVCLNEFEEDEMLCLLPKCDHVFHPECIGAWLEAHVTCPVCRANLVPQPGEEPVRFPTPVLDTTDGSRSEEVVIRVEADGSDRARVIDRNMSFEFAANRPQRSWSMKMFGFDKFRSRSTGQSLVHLGENLDRFTLRLPAEVRKEMMNRTGSWALTLPREGSGRTGRSYRRFDREAKSDRWVFFGRGLSMKSSKNVAEIGAGSSHGGSSSSRRPVKMPSFRCLEPKAVDETGLVLQDQLAENSE